MYFRLKNILKSIYYKASRRGRLKPYNIKLGYIFHTEKIYNTQIFNNLISFCKEYYIITGAKPICTIIPPTNLLLKKEMDENNFSEIDFLSRIIELSQYSTIGYHGHFYLNSEPKYYNGIHCNNFNEANLVEQFNNDVKWFENNSISHNNIYAAGWWFINKELVKLLIENNFEFDFSFSRASFFYNQYSNEILNKHKIDTGKVFSLHVNSKRKLTCIQNFIGMHTTAYPEDFDRNLMKLKLDNKELIGVVNSHDYDLDIKNTLKCIKYQINVNKIRFESFEVLTSIDLEKSIAI
jgi:hypothetical protein